MSASFPHLASPLWLLLLAALPLLAWLHHRHGGAGALLYSRLPASRRGTRGISWRLHLPFYLRLAALALLVVALARPQMGYAWEESTTEGIDIQIALDVSGSMGAQDFQPQNRLEVAREVVKGFVDGRLGDRIGVVVFAGAALTKSPLTTDHQMLRFLVDSVRLDELPRGTAIGVALATAASRLADSEAESKVIVLVTDGANNAGEIDPRSAAALAEGLGIRVYTIGVGRGGLVPIQVPFTDRSGRQQTRQERRVLPVDEDLLEEIAQRTGGRFYRATDARALAAVFEEIDQLETTELTVKRYVRYEEAFAGLVWAALGLLVLPLATTFLGMTAEP